MKIYGHGQLNYPGTGRTIWDFEDGPFDCVNPQIIEEAKRRGFSFTPPPPPPEPEKRKPGRPPKVAPEGEAPEKKKAVK